MGENMILYGPPGTGKTFELQNLKSKYTNYSITNEKIENTFNTRGETWLLITLIMLQNNNQPMNIHSIQEKIDSLNITRTLAIENGVSIDLANHRIKNNVDLFGSIPPKIFREKNNEWYLDINYLLSFMPNFFDVYELSSNLIERFKFVTFHPSFSYEDFIEGIKPVITTEDKESPEITNENTGLSYRIEDGIFKQICNEARADSNNTYAIFIDEINRGNISEIFGELITLIESDKRAGKVNELKVTLPYSKTEFVVPNNLDIIGTMNTADRSIALIDIALRRRFVFIKKDCDLEVLKEILANKNIDINNFYGIDIAAVIYTINRRISVLVGEDYKIGHAFFTKVESLEDLNAVFINKIIPLLEEYFVDNLEKIQLIFNDLDNNGDLHRDAIYLSETLELDSLFSYLDDFDADNYKSYSINPDITANSYRKIYT